MLNRLRSIVFKIRRQAPAAPLSESIRRMNRLARLMTIESRAYQNSEAPHEAPSVFPPQVNRPPNSSTRQSLQNKTLREETACYAACKPFRA